MPGSSKSIKDLQWEINELQNKLVELDYEKSQRKKAEASLNESEENFRALAENANDGILIVNQKGYFVFANERASEITGFSENQLRNMTFKDIIHPDERGKLIKRFKDRFSGKSLKSHIETIIITIDGRELPVDAATSLTEWKSEPASMIIFRDISERKRAEEALRESRALYRDIIQNVDEIIYNVELEEDSLSSKISFMSSKIKTITGHDPEEFIIDPELWYQSVHPDDRDHVNAITQRLINEKIPQIRNYRHRIKGQDEYVWLEDKVLPKIDDNGKVVGLFGAARDITERMKAREALRQERDSAQNYLDLAGVMFVALDTDQKVSMINQKGCDILGYTEEKVVGKNWFDNFIPENECERVKAGFNDIISGNIEPVEYFENTVLTSDGQERTIAWHNATILDEKGMIIGTLSSGEDITDRKQTKVALKESEEQFRMLSEQNFMAILILQDGKMKYANSTTAELAETSIDELFTWSFTDLIEFIHPEDREFVAEQAMKKQAGEENGVLTNYPSRVLTKSGKLKWIEIYSKTIQYKGKPADFVALVDITERKDAGKALMDSEDKYKSFFDSMAHGAITQDAEQNILSMNPAAERILGITFDQFKSMAYKDERWKAKKPNGEQFSDNEFPIYRVFTTGEKVLGVAMGVFNPEKNKTIWISVNAIPQFKEGEDKPYLVYATFDDITEQIEKKIKNQ